MYTGKFVFETAVFSKNNRRFSTQIFDTMDSALAFVRQFPDRKWYITRARDFQILTAGNTVTIAQSVYKGS